MCGKRRRGVLCPHDFVFAIWVHNFDMNRNTGKSRMALLRGSAIARVGSANALGFSIIDCMVSTAKKLDIDEDCQLTVGAHAHDKTIWE